MTSSVWKTDTAVSSSPRSPRYRLWLLASLFATTGACSGGPRPPAQPPPQTVTEPAPGGPAANSTQPAPAEPPALPELRPPPVKVVIEPADPEPDPEPTLAEAARRERQRRRQTGEPIAVINDANLQEHATGLLTFLEEEEVEPATDPASVDGTGSGEGERGEQYWRDRVRELRQRWADAASEVPVLEERVAELRRRFYATDDAYYRDTRIKPAWDRAIDLIAQTRVEGEAHHLELEAALEEGRLAGALPGWLREGIELEPAPPEPEPDAYEPGEPTIFEPGRGGGE